MTTQTSKKGSRFFPFLISLLIPLAIGFIASLFIRPEITGWYATLQKPPFEPPSGLFAQVWTGLYIMMGIAAYLVWAKRNRTARFYTAASIYCIQLLLNFSWSIVFFGMHQVFGALIVMILLWVSIVLNMVWFHRFSKAASWLLLPYLIWVSFATVLNLYIYLLNG